MRQWNTMVWLGLILVLSTHPAIADVEGGAETNSVEFLEDADRAAWQWTRENPDGIAISIRLGDATPLTPDVIERTLRADFASQDVRKLQFFWERGGSGGSSVAFDTRNHAWGPFGLASARKEVEEAARQLLFEVKRGLH